jgi:hypothetical protein
MVVDNVFLDLVAEIAPELLKVEMNTLKNSTTP